ncbi:MAG: zinc-binding alcohol dehydrogenase [Chloroflexi bacterium]|nr:zinc-binding alcohol dehydrogenase [Chloroflexota bacterium]
MQAKAIICDEQQNFTYADVILPEPSPEQIVVRPRYSGVSIGTEFALIRNKISWGPYPLCTGYMAIGTVEDVGKNVSGFQTGDKVYYRDNKTIHLADGQKVSAVTGTHCSLALIDPNNTHGVALLPAGVNEEAASMYVMPAVGLNGVDMANPRMGETVVVFGAGLIGLGVVAACSQRGCIVVAIDLAESRLAMAKEFGADHVINSKTHNAQEVLKQIAPSGADVVFEATGIPACIDPAMALCKTHGKFVYQGNYGAAPISYHFLPPHGKRLTAFYPCDDGLAPCRRAVIKNMAMGALPWERTITHRVQAADAPALFAAINQGKDDILGAIIQWS